jgi:hypothetical protein
MALNPYGSESMLNMFRENVNFVIDRDRRKDPEE